MLFEATYLPEIDATVCCTSRTERTSVIRDYARHLLRKDYALCQLILLHPVENQRNLIKRCTNLLKVIDIQYRFVYLR